jgi:hypothetical protein
MDVEKFQAPQREVIEYGCSNGLSGDKQKRDLPH